MQLDVSAAIKTTHAIPEILNAVHPIAYAV